MMVSVSLEGADEVGGPQQTGNVDSARKKRRQHDRRYQEGGDRRMATWSRGASTAGRGGAVGGSTLRMSGIIATPLSNQIAMASS